MTTNLHHPYLKIKPDSTFPSAWESFCLKALQISNPEDRIIKTPRNYKGIDIYNETKKYAYECKSKEKDGLDTFNFSNFNESLGHALGGNCSFRWTKYFICVNIHLSDSKKENIIAKCKSLFLQYGNYKNITDVFEIYDKGHWDLLCKNHPYQISPFFSENIIESLELSKIEINNESDLYGLLLKLPFSYDQSVQLKSWVELIDNKEYIEKVFSFANNLLTDLINSSNLEPHSEVLGLISNLFSKKDKYWLPSKKSSKSISERLMKLMNEEDSYICGIVEPLCFTMGLKGDINLYNKFLKNSISSSELRIADSNRWIQYYNNSESNQIFAMQGHLKDKRRLGKLVFAHDTSKQIEYLKRAINESNPQKIKIFTELLLQVLNSLNKLGQSALLNYILKDLRNEGIYNRVFS